MADDVKQPADDTPKADTPVTPPETKFTATKEDPVQGARNAAEVTPAVDLKATAPSADGSTAAATTEEKKADPVTPPAANATAPVEEKKAEAPVNTAPPVEEKAEKKDGDAPAAPVAETEEEIRKKKEAEANANKPQQQQQTAPATGDNTVTDEQLQQSKFATNLNVHPESLKTLRATWPDTNFQLVEEFASVLREGEKSIYPHKGGLVFELANNHAIEWHANLGGAEFIGMPNRSKKFDEVDAHGVMAAARQRGWKSVNVYGNDAQKDMMYLAAVRQGLEVANYAPPPGSDTELKAEKIKAGRNSANADALLVGASAAEQGPIDLSKFAAPKADDKKPEEPKQEAPKQETTAATPPAETAKTEAPKALDGLEGFLDKKIEAAKADPELQKGITALRDGIKSGAIAVDDTSASLIRNALGKDDTAPSEPKKYAEIEGFLRNADKANDGLRLPAVTTTATKETPAAIVPKEAKPAKNAVAPA